MKFIRCHLPATNDDGARAYIHDGYTGVSTPVGPYRELWSRFNREWLENLFKVIHSYYKAAQYDQVPSMGDLAFFLMSEDIPRWTDPSVQLWWLAVDAANAATAAGSETAMCAVGIYGNRLKLLGAKSGRYRVDAMAPETMSFAADMMRLTGIPPERCLIERAAGGYGLLERLEGHLPIEAVTPLGSKEDRAGDVCFLVNQHRVEFPVKPSHGVAKLMQQLGDFPLCSLKDLVDAFVHCLKFTQYSSVTMEVKPRDEEIILIDAIEEDRLLGDCCLSDAFRVGPFEEW